MMWRKSGMMAVMALAGGAACSESGRSFLGSDADTGAAEVDAVEPDVGGGDTKA